MAKEEVNFENKKKEDSEEKLMQMPHQGAEIPEKAKKELEKTKVKLNLFKKQIIKKFPSLVAISLMPPQASKIIEDNMEDEESSILAKEKEKEKILHLLIIVPDEKEKEIGKIKLEAIKLCQQIKPKVWLHLKTPNQIWEIGFDGKYELVDAIAASFPLHDKGLLGALRVANVHKFLVLNKFEKYVVSYVIAGSMVRGTSTKTSDVDVYVVIDDTDVKRMNRLELKEKLRGLIYAMTVEAGERAGVKNKLSPQIYILTEFWEAVKDAHPVIFTFIRDGVPLYDRGAFMPWKQLLRMGKIKPSPEAIEMFMALGERVSDSVKTKLNEIATEDIYWGVITPSQAVLMLYGVAPPTPRETVALMKEIFVDKEKMLEQKYVDILGKIFDTYKQYEHEKVKTITGKQIDELMQETNDYIARLKKLMEQIEKRARERTVNEIYENLFNLLSTILNSGKRLLESEIIKKFNSELIAKGIISNRGLILLQNIIKAKEDYKKGKLDKREVDTARRDASELVNMLVEYTQRKELIALEKKRILVKYKKKDKEKQGELFATKDFIFVVSDVSETKESEEKIQKINKDGKILDASKEELIEAVKTEWQEKLKLNTDILESLGKIFGKFELAM